MRRFSFHKYITLREDNGGISGVHEHIKKLQDSVNRKGMAEYIRDARLRAYFIRCLDKITAFLTEMDEDPDEELVRLKDFQKKIDREWVEFEADRIVDNDPGNRWNISKIEDKVEKMLADVFERIAATIGGGNA